MANKKEEKKKTPIEEKRLKQSKIRNKRNVSVKRSVKTAFKKAEAAVFGNGEGIEELVRKAVKAIDTASSKGIIKKNTAARKKSRLMLKANKALATK
ncbi:MAG: 30S ribosomal protein S20 [bacterium]|nr:30S ribosomal protein S20 [bacterium]